MNLSLINRIIVVFFSISYVIWFDLLLCVLLKHLRIDSSDTFFYCYVYVYFSRLNISFLLRSENRIPVQDYCF